MSNEKRVCTADMILTVAIEDYAANTNQDVASVRDQIIESGAYDALYDFDTDLWTQGPDHFISFFLEKTKDKPVQRG